MPPRCWLAQSDGAHGGLTSPPSMRKFQRVSNLPASPSRWTLVQYGTGPMSALGQKRTLADLKRKDRLAAVFRNCCVLVMTRSIASGHWQTEALFFEFFPYPFKLLVV